MLGKFIMFSQIRNFTNNATQGISRTLAKVNETQAGRTGLRVAKVGLNLAPSVFGLPPILGEMLDTLIQSGTEAYKEEKLIHR